MKIYRHQLARGEIDHELLWLSISLAAFVGAVFWMRLGLAWPRCIFQELTSHPCVTCGATRCAVDFFHGHFISALSWNPLAFFALCALGVFDGYALAVLLAGLPRLRMEMTSPRSANALRITAVAALALNWLYELHRLA